MAAAVAAAAALTLTACSGSSDSNSSSTSAAKSSANLGLLGSVSSFSAADMEWGNQAPYVQAVYDTLLRQDTKGAVIAGLASKWSYNDDQTVLTLTLHDGVKFTDGTPLNADAVAKNLIRFRDGASSAKANLANMADATAVDDTTVKITLKESDPGLLIALAQAAGAVEAPSHFGSADEKTVPLGSGPYELDAAKSVPGSTYQFTANPDYWDKASQHYDALTFTVLTDSTAMLNAIKGHQVNFGVIRDNKTLDQVKSAGYKLVSIQASWVGMLYFDRDGAVNPALGDVRVRQALNYAFDRKGLLKTVGSGAGTTTTQIFPTTSAAYDPALDNKYSFDPAKAKKLLTEAGYPNGFALEMPSPPGQDPATNALIVQQLKDVGVTATFVDAGANFFPDILAQKYAVSPFGLAQDPDWTLINFQVAPNATFNPFHNADPKIDELIQTIHDSQADETTLNAALKELNTYLVDQAWFGTWYRPDSNFAVDSATTAEPQAGNALPSLWNIKPAA
ncbi:ABC transporter substrate-binding protein [Cellulomonas sp. McL0617]|uniref:ABC transporter substrate-binding protein n=1 Tax=Cellulomonas sp. McL0617 TaxID=3415675 RepID=UPI003CF167E4